MAEFLSSCKLCFSERIRPRYVLARYGLTIFECDACSLRFVGDDLSDDRIDRLYQQPALAEYFCALGARHDRKFAPRLVELARAGVTPGSRVVDVGCGSGEFPAMAAAAGYAACGIDVSEPSIEVARKLHRGVDFRVADASDLAVSELESFDVVTLWDVIEHVLRPHEVIASAATLLRPGGLIVLGTPNGASIYDRVADALYRVVPPIGKLMLMQRYSEWHLQIWTARTLSRLLRDHGLETVFLRKHRELTGTPSLYFRQAGFTKLAAVAQLSDGLIEAAWPIRNKLTIYARKTG